MVRRPQADGKRVLITDGEERSALAACRSLHGAGYRVTTTYATRWAPARWSKASVEAHRLPDPRSDPRVFVAALVDIVRRDAYAALIPGTDAALLAVSQHRDELEPHVRLGLPPHGVVERCLDKLELAEGAERAGIQSPETIAGSTSEDALRAVEQFGYPVVVKPRRTLFFTGSGLRQQASVRVANAAELATALRRCGPDWLIQPAIDGAVHSFSGVRTAEGLIARGFSRYLRTWPVQAGNASFAYTIPLPPALAARVEALLADLGWVGIFELELVERPDGELAAIDLNPRLFGSLALVSAAGAPLAELWCRWLCGETIARRTARAARTYRWEDGELRNFVGCLRRGRLSDAAAMTVPRRGLVHAFFAPRDPLPLAARAMWLASLRRQRARAAKEELAAAAHSVQVETN